jgi:hypothetical protein
VEPLHKYVSTHHKIIISIILYKPTPCILAKFSYSPQKRIIVAFIVEFFAHLWLWKHFMVSVYNGIYMCNNTERMPFSKQKTSGE